MQATITQPTNISNWYFDTVIIYSSLQYLFKYSFSELDLPSTSFFSNKRRSSKHIHDKIGEGPMKLILNQDLLREALLATLKLNASRILQHFYFKGFFTKSLKVEGIFSLHMLMIRCNVHTIQNKKKVSKRIYSQHLISILVIDNKM